MFIRAENLSKITIQDIDMVRRVVFEKSLESSRQDFEEEQKKRAASASHYPIYAIKPIEELTRDERKMLIDAYFDSQIALIKSLGALAMNRSKVKAGVQHLKEKRNAPISDAELLDMRNEIFPPLKVETQDPDEPRIREDYEKNIYFAIQKSSLLTEDFDRLCETAKHYLAQGMAVKVLIDEKMSDQENEDKSNYIYTKEEKEKIIQLHKLINENGAGDIRFSEFRLANEAGGAYQFESAWTLNDVARANNAIDSIVDYIKVSNFSPFETMVFIHQYITSTFEYKEGKIEACRVIPGAFKNGDIVCAGYASMVKAIIDKLDNKDLSCDIVGCSLYKGRLFSHLDGGHSHNMIHIHDEKYGIDGVYMEDACWDSKRKKFPEGRGFAHCLYPVTDLEHFRGATYVPSTSDDRFSNLIADTKDPNLKKKFIRRSDLPRPWMTVQYGDQSEPIPMDKYEECLKRVFELKYEGDKKAMEEKIDSLLKSSALIAKSEFKEGDSCFYSTDRYKFKRRELFSLAKNDGREEETNMENE